MFSDIAPTYDLLNSLMSFRLHHRWRRLATRRLNLSHGDKALDVCCGTGDFLPHLQRAVGPKGVVAGLDFALPMLQRATPKSDACLFLGDASCLPFLSESFDGVSVGWGLRNVPSLQTVLAEVVRVLRSEGRFVCLDMTRTESLVGRLSSKVFQSVVPVLGRLFGRSEAYTYLPKSTQRFPTAEELAESLQDAGFIHVGFRRLFFGSIAMHWGSKP